jgi:hypothetical protein
MELKSFCTVMETATRVKRHATWEEFFANCSFDKGLTTRIYVECKELKSERTRNPTNK